MPVKNSSAAIRRSPPRPADHDGRAQRQHAGRQFGSRIGMREAAADGAAVADRGMGDMRHRLRAAAARASRFQATSGDRHAASARRCAASRRFTAMPRSSASPPISTINSGETSRRFIAGIRLWPPDSTLAPSPCDGEQLQRIGNAGRAGIGESRGFHSGEPSPARFLCFRGIRGWTFQRSRLA